MKRILATAAALLLLTVNVFAQDGKGIYNKYSDCDDVSAVYISSAMFKMIGKVPDMNLNSGSIKLGSLIKNLDCMYVLDCDDDDLSEEIKSDVKKFLKKYEFELLMEMKESGEVVRIYTLGTEKIVNHFILTASAEDTFTFICLDGKMNRDDLEKEMAKAAKTLGKDD